MLMLARISTAVAAARNSNEPDGQHFVGPTGQGTVFDEGCIGYRKPRLVNQSVTKGPVQF